jgi:NTE family protein
MKYILILILVFTTIFANDRPKIALVLSGGGARGAAHAGVLKILEEKNIPIDMIVGTSMGSFIGGLYASGKSPQEIEDMLVSTDWHKYIRTEFNRKDIPIRKKKFQYTYPGRLGLGINSKNELVLPTGILKREPLLLKFLKETEHVDHINDFDKLNIPFRAVATNIRNGDMVVLKSGKLGEAIYASSAIPGGLQPIKLNGIDLVDGGVSSNLPIEVAREMGADIIIAVDVSEHFDEDLDVNSYFVVTAQLVNILMRKNADKSIETLTDKDVLLTPILDNYNGLDSDKHAHIIESGEAIANNEYESKLKHLSLSNDEYALYLKKRDINLEEDSVVIDEIRIVNRIRSIKSTIILLFFIKNFYFIFSLKSKS